ncbi:MAG: rod shape-determining protein MreD, partial [Lachnospiraceae bacterium]|nr:rod shape-determining protein MreD [Lachnospiraceae bacterium]
MTRKVVMAILILVTAFLQCSVFQIFQVASIKPNLLLIVTVSFALMRGRRGGLLTGFFCGLVLDLFFPGQIGLHAFLYMWIGYLCGYSFRIFYDDDIKTPVLLVAVSDLVYGFALYLLTFLMRGRIHFFYYLGRIIIPETLYTIVMTILFYRLLFSLNRSLEKTDKRRID